MERIGDIGKIREACLNDFKDIHECNIRNLPIYYSVLELVNMWFSKYFHIIVLDINHKICGYAIYNVKDTNNYQLISIAIDKQYRNMGYGTKLLNYIKVLDSNCKQVSLKVSVINNNAINCYKKNGFVIIEEIKNYYETLPGNKNAFTMTKDYLS